MSTTEAGRPSTTEAGRPSTTEAGRPSTTEAGRPSSPKSPNLQLQRYNQRQLLQEVTSLVEPVLDAYDKLAKNEISINEFWGNKDRGNLYDVLKHFKDDATKFNLGDGEKDLIGYLLVNIPNGLSNLNDPRSRDDRNTKERIQADIRELYLSMVDCLKSYIRRLKESDNNIGQAKDTKIQQQVRAEVKNDEKQISIEVLRKLYNIIDTMNALKFGVQRCLMIRANVELMINTAFSHETIADKFKTDCKELMIKVQSELKISNKTMEDIHSNLSNQIDELIECFTSTPVDGIGNMKSIMGLITKDIDTLWEVVVTNVLDSATKGWTVQVERI